MSNIEIDVDAHEPRRGARVIRPTEVAQPEPAAITAAEMALAREALEEYGERGGISATRFAALIRVASSLIAREQDSADDLVRASDNLGSTRRELLEVAARQGSAIAIRELATIEKIETMLADEARIE